MFGKSRDDGQILKSQKSPGGTKKNSKKISNIQTERNKKKAQA